MHHKQHDFYDIILKNRKITFEADFLENETQTAEKRGFKFYIHANGNKDTTLYEKQNKYTGFMDNYTQLNEFGSGSHDGFVGLIGYTVG